MLKKHRHINNLRKYTLLFSVFALAAIIGSLWIGMNLTLWILGLGALLSIYSINLAPSRILKWQGATKLDMFYYSELYDTIHQLASRAGLSRAPDLYIVKSKVPNAFALGTKEKPVIGFSQGLVSLLSQRELQGVMAHEISHIKNNDLFIKGLALSFGNLTNTLSTIGKILLFLSLPFYLMGVEFISILALLLLVLSPMLNILLQLGLSRSMELLADYDAASLTGDPLGLASALNRIETISRPWWKILSPGMYTSSDWLSSHPETRKRIEKLRTVAEQYPAKESVKIHNRKIPSMFLTRKPFYWM